MTYNTHGCGGVDGRVSPRRIARAIANINLHRGVAGTGSRTAAFASRGPGGIIARELGLHAVFADDHARRGTLRHALLTHWRLNDQPLALPHDPRSWWQEPRSAIWARIQVRDDR